MHSIGKDFFGSWFMKFKICIYVTTGQPTHPPTHRFIQPIMSHRKLACTAVEATICWFYFIVNYWIYFIHRPIHRPTDPLTHLTKNEPAKTRVYRSFLCVNVTIRRCFWNVAFGQSSQILSVDTIQHSYPSWIKRNPKSNDIDFGNKLVKDDKTFKANHPQRKKQ